MVGRCRSGLRMPTPTSPVSRRRGHLADVRKERPSVARSSFGKRDRDQAKKAKAAAKRERQQRALETKADEASTPKAPATASTDDLLRKIEEVHQQYDEGALSYEDFEAAK